VHASQPGTRFLPASVIGELLDGLGGAHVRF
jgi:hypothetical protein